MTLTKSTSPTALDQKILETDLTDPVLVTQDLIRCQSVTPFEGGALTLLEGWLSRLGFTCHRLTFSDENTPDVENLFAIRRGQKDVATDGDERPYHFCFAGHTDVVPAGPLPSWDQQPFAAKVQKNHIIGRGAVDMKGGIACFLSALARLDAQDAMPDFTISFLITGDEEDVAINGTKKVLTWMQDQSIELDFCLVGEPSSVMHLGDTIKIGRRGSLNTKMTYAGKQGHVAFPEKSDNPVPKMVACLNTLSHGPTEGQSEFFDPSNLEVTSIDVGNKTTNLIPERITAMFNIRFNDLHTGETPSKWIQDTANQHCDHVEFEFEFSGEAEFVEPNDTVDHLVASITDVTGLKPDLTTAGATSDARFIRYYCPVIEFGLVGETMHQINERVALSDLENLTEIYKAFLLKTAEFENTDQTGK